MIMIGPDTEFGIALRGFRTAMAQSCYFQLALSGAKVLMFHKQWPGNPALDNVETFTAGTVPLMLGGF